MMKNSSWKGHGELTEWTRREASLPNGPDEFRQLGFVSTRQFLGSPRLGTSSSGVIRDVMKPGNYICLQHGSFPNIVIKTFGTITCTEYLASYKK